VATTFSDLIIDDNGFFILHGHNYFSILGAVESFVFKTDFEIGDTECHDFYGAAVDSAPWNEFRFEPPIYQYEEHWLHTVAAVN